jgi:hypothetical protein
MVVFQRYMQAHWGNIGVGARRICITSIPIDNTVYSLDNIYLDIFLINFKIDRYKEWGLTSETICFL